MYFKKNGTGFDTNSPENHFKSFITPSGTSLDKHIQWLEDISETVRARVTNENETLRNPSFYSYTKLLRRLPVPTLLQSTLKNLYQLALQNLSCQLSLLSWSWKRDYNFSDGDSTIGRGNYRNLEYGFGGTGVRL